MGHLIILDIFIRGGAITLLLFTALSFSLQNIAIRKSLSVAAFTIGLSAYLIVSSANLQMFPPSISYPLKLLASTNPVLVYWAGIELFVDKFKFRWWHIAIAFLIISSSWFHALVPGFEIIRSIIVVGIYLHLFLIAFSTSADDLIEGRRQFRRWFLAIMALVALVIGLVELSNLDKALPHYIYPLHAFVFFVLAFIFSIWSGKIRTDIWAPPIPTKPAPNITAAENAVLSRLESAMLNEVWKTESLTIGKLAQDIDTPEHRLRRIINQILGHRNFSTFINEPRIAAAKTRLADPELAEISILTIAHEVGFASLGPFNRAFREVTNDSPSEYRQKLLAPAVFKNHSPSLKKQP